MTDVQPGYYEQGKWRPGATTGYYDTQGRWVRVEQSGTQYGGNRGPTDIDGRQAWLDDRIRDSMRDGAITRSEGDRALRSLAAIEREERTLRNRNGVMPPRGERLIQARLDTLTADVREMRRGPVRQY